MTNVKLKIKPPKQLTDRQREAIIKFAEDEDFKGTINEEEKSFFSSMKDKLKK